MLVLVLESTTLETLLIIHPPVDKLVPARVWLTPAVSQQLLFLFWFKVQATVVGFLAAVAAVVLGWIPEGKFQMSHAVLLCSSSVATAFIASLLQGKNVPANCQNRQKKKTKRKKTLD